METVSLGAWTRPRPRTHELLDRYEEEMLRALPDRVLEAAGVRGAALSRARLRVTR